MRRTFADKWQSVGALATPTMRRNLRPDFSAARARRGRGGVSAGLTRGRKTFEQVAKEEELELELELDTDTSLDNDDNTMVTWEEEEESE